MASYLQVENISKAYGDKVLLHDICFNINEGDKIALIAPNGSGKTTLLNILAGKDHSDSGGSIKFLKDIKIAYLEQEFDYDPSLSVFEQVCARVRHSGDNWEWEHKVHKVLTNLGLGEGDKLMSVLSGGEVKRVAIAVLLAQEADFLVMDEPTNHLDIEIIEYLEDYLGKSRCTLFMVTHDRYFLDRVCNTILELDKGVLYTYKGNYSFFLEKREERIANAMAEVDKARNIYRRELEWIRSTPCARTGKAKYRIDAFNELKERTVGDFEQKKVNINVQSARLGKKIINCKDLSFWYGEKCMLDHFTYNFARFEKVGIVGDNGVGKSTFLKLMCGELPPAGGSIETGETIVFGHYRQEGISFNDDDTVFDAAHNIAEVVTLGDGNKVPVSTFLNYFLFPPSVQYTKIGRLSGGEKRRLYLLTVLMRNPNFLILDEPTNDLDIMTLNVLEEYLQSFGGCLMVVSHDRYFLDKIADHLLIFKGEGKVKDFVGRYSDYRDYVHMLRAQSSDAFPEVSGAQAYKAAKKEAAAAAVVASGGKRKLTFKEKRLYEQLQADIPALEQEKTALEESLSSGSLSVEELTAASSRIGEIIDLLDEKTLQLLEIEELL